MLSSLQPLHQSQLDTYRATSPILQAPHHWCFHNQLNRTLVEFFLVRVISAACFRFSQPWLLFQGIDNYRYHRLVVVVVVLWSSSNILPSQRQLVNCPTVCRVAPTDMFPKCQSVLASIHAIEKRTNSDDIGSFISYVASPDANGCSTR